MPVLTPAQVLGRVIHLSVDAILISTVLAGIKRSSGLQYPHPILFLVSCLTRRLKTDGIENKDVRSAVNKYLNVGDWVLDQSIAFMAASSYFERKR